jgi:putative spermidine/putrescine transport system ATP-binding protein
LIRPERLRRVRPGALAPKGCNVFSGVVADTIFQGDSIRIEIALPDGGAIALRSQYAEPAAAPLPQRGEAIEVALAYEDSILLRQDNE